MKYKILFNEKYNKKGGNDQSSVQHIFPLLNNLEELHDFYDLLHLFKKIKMYI